MITTYFSECRVGQWAKGAPCFGAPKQRQLPRGGTVGKLCESHYYELLDEATRKLNPSTRPAWCPLRDNCAFVEQVADKMCCGRPPKPVMHDVVANDMRLCLYFESTEEVFNVAIDKVDLDWFRYLFDRLDGQRTSTVWKREVRTLEAEGEETRTNA